LARTTKVQRRDGDVLQRGRERDHRLRSSRNPSPLRARAGSDLGENAPEPVTFLRHASPPERSRPPSLAPRQLAAVVLQDEVGDLEDDGLERIAVVLVHGGRSCCSVTCCCWSASRVPLRQARPPTETDRTRSAPSSTTLPTGVPSQDQGRHPRRRPSRPGSRARTRVATLVDDPPDRGPEPGPRSARV
jgi:hypothetical protein